MKKLLLAVAIACGFAAPARAALTEAEKAHQLRVWDIGQELRRAVRSTAWTINACGIARKRFLTRQHGYAVAALNEFNEAEWRFVGAQPDNVLVQTDRAAVTAEAYWYLDRTAGLARAVVSHLDAVLATRELTEACRSNTQATRDAWSWVPVSIGRLDRSLTYLDPLPFPPAPFVPPVVGPHGDYPHKQGQLATGTGYVLRMVDSVQQGWSKWTVESDVMGHPLWAAADTVEVLHHSYLLAAGVRVFESDPADNFCAALRDARVLTGSRRAVVPGEPDQSHAASFKFHGLQQALARVAPYIETPWLQDAMFRLSDAWEKIDRAVWELFRFANPSRCGA